MEEREDGGNKRGRRELSNRTAEEGESRDGTGEGKREKGKEGRRGKGGKKGRVG